MELFVRRCDICCRYRKGPMRPQGPMKNGVALAPFQKFHIDITGPHLRSAGGHVYLLTGICCFTKYLIAVPLRDKSALTVDNALLKMSIRYTVQWNSRSTTTVLSLTTQSFFISSKCWESRTSVAPLTGQCSN